MFVMTYKMEEQKREKKLHIIYAVLAVIVTVAGAVLASITTNTRSDWYTSLVLSPIQPPPWVFGAVWTPLYILLAISFALAALSPKLHKSIVIGYVLNIALNALWSPVFFGLHNPIAAQIILFALIINVVILMISLQNVRKVCLYLLIPYLIWLCIASVLNISVMILN